MKQIDYLTTVPLYIEMFLRNGEQPIGIGTAFVVKYNQSYYLITNWHCVTGINPNSDKPINKNGLHNPDYMRVWFSKKILGFWRPTNISLVDSEYRPTWIEHPQGKHIDVVALPLKDLSVEIQLQPLDIRMPTNLLKVYPSKAVSIIGFPKGITSSGKFPIWKKGHIASDLAINFNGQPLFLIDSTTRPGMSGSPVVLKESGMCEFENNGIAQGTFTRFLGVYSGRIDKDIEIGRVWKLSVLYDILENCT